MLFCQFFVIDSNGESYVIIEFKFEVNGSGYYFEVMLCYELDDGCQLVCNGCEFIISGGELWLMI